MIPKIIWQTHKYELEELPSYIATPIQSWISANPDFEHRYVSQPEKDDYMRSFSIPELSELYFRPGTNMIHQADIWRVAVVYEYGGFYADSDLYCLSPVREVVTDSTELILNRSDGQFFRDIEHLRPFSDEACDEIDNAVKSVYAWQRGPFLQNHFFGATAGSVFIEKVIESMLSISGPASIKDADTGKYSKQIGVMEVGPPAWCMAFSIFCRSVDFFDIAYIDTSNIFIDINGSRTWNDGPFDELKMLSLADIFRDTSTFAKKTYSNNNHNIGTLKFHLSGGHGKSYYYDGVDHGF